MLLPSVCNCLLRFPAFPRSPLLIAEVKITTLAANVFYFHSFIRVSFLPFCCVPLSFPVAHYACACGWGIVFFFLFRACQETFLTRFLYPVRRRTALSSCNIWISGCDCAVRPRRCFSFVSSIRLRHLPIHCIRLLIFLCLTEQCCCGGKQDYIWKGQRTKQSGKAAKEPPTIQLSSLWIL